MSTISRLCEYEGYWLTKRSDSKYLFIAWWPHEPGTRRVRRVSTGTEDLVQARDKLIAHVEKIKEDAKRTAFRPELPRTDTTPGSLQGTPHDPVILDLLCDYIERLADKPSYQSSAKPMLRHWMQFIQSERVLFVSDFTLEKQEAYVAWRKQIISARTRKPVCNGTPIRELGIIKAAFRNAWLRKRLVAVPGLMTLDHPPARDRFLTVSEVHRLLAECTQPHLRLFVLLALHTLQRPIAIFGLHCSQIDLDKGRINFLPPGSMQTRKRRPVVPITETLRPELAKAMRESVSGYLVEWKGLPLTTIRNAFAKACKRAGLHDVHPYVLRHTGATLLAAAGVPLRQIAGMLGHTQERTTEIYAKHQPEFLKDAATALDRLFGVAPMPQIAGQSEIDLHSSALQCTPVEFAPIVLPAAFVPADAALSVPQLSRCGTSQALDIAVKSGSKSVLANNSRSRYVGRLRDTKRCRSSVVEHHLGNRNIFSTKDQTAHTTTHRRTPLTLEREIQLKSQPCDAPRCRPRQYHKK